MTLAAAVAFLSSPTGLLICSLVAAWVGGKGLVAIIQNPGTGKFLGTVLNTAKIPAVIVGKWLQAGPLHVIAGPIICLLVFFGFWFFTFLDGILESQKPDVQKLVESMEKVLSNSGSTDRRLYIQSKTLTTAESKVVSQMADAVSAAPSALDSEQKAVLSQARVIGAHLQSNRLSS